MLAFCRLCHNCTKSLINTVGVYVRLQNKVYSNNSDILITDIGIDIDDSLFCFTDLISSECCNNRVEADWFYPNGSAVGISTAGEKFFKHRGNSRVRLHRKDNATSPTGLFCCQLPDAANKIFRICVNISEYKKH